MWFVVLMMAEDWDSAIIQLSDAEYETIKKFLEQIEEQRHPFSWVGGHWKISHPCATKEEAEAISLFDLADE